MISSLLWNHWRRIGCLELNPPCKLFSSAHASSWRPWRGVSWSSQYRRTSGSGLGSARSTWQLHFPCTWSTSSFLRARLFPWCSPLGRGWPLPCRGSRRGLSSSHPFCLVSTFSTAFGSFKRPEPSSVLGFWSLWILCQVLFRLERDIRHTSINKLVYLSYDFDT